MSQQLNAIIIEDEEASITTLKNYLSKYCPQVNVVAEAGNINHGYKLIKEKNPQLVFLDVEMPYGNAFDLLEKFEKIEFETIFVTAFSQYALDALNLSACSYLLKPVNIDELIEAVNKAKTRVENKKYIITSNILLENLFIENKQLKKLVLPLLDGFEVVVLKNVIRCQANDNLTDIFLSDKSKRTVCKTLKFYEETLKEYDFIRIHKSHLINIHYVKKYKKGKGGELTLIDGSKIEVSSTRKDLFLERFL